MPRSEARLRLFCLPHAGGSAALFRAWSAGLPPWVQVCPVELPGRGARLREPAFRALLPLAHALLQALYPCLDRPFALFGHSLGALLAFELARLLQRGYGLTPRLLCVAGREAPQYPEREQAHALEPQAFLTHLRRLAGTLPELLDNAELMALLLPTLRADFAASETYVYTASAPLDCPLVVFTGREDDGVGADGLAGWSLHTHTSPRTHVLPGGHFFVQGAPPALLARLSDELRACL